jgi:hypothetical protein
MLIIRNLYLIDLTYISCVSECGHMTPSFAWASALTFNDGIRLPGD